MRWWGWGEAGHDGPLPGSAERLLSEELGVEGSRLEPVGFESVRLPEAALPDSARAALERIVGAEHVRDDRRRRIEHAVGKSYPDLVRIRAGDAGTAPDAVVYPGSPDEVDRVLAACAEAGVAVVPFGGGSSVVGGVEALRGPFESVISLDLGCLSGMIELTPRDALARFGAGTLGPDVERELGARGHTLGHLPQSFEFSTIGGWAATRSAGQASTGYGRIDELVVSVGLSTPTGRLNSLTVPATAAGPDLRELVLGSEGTLGVITEVAVRVRRRPAERRYEAWAFESFEAGADALRELEQSGIAPDLARLSDPEETRLSLSLSGSAATGALSRYLSIRGMAEPCLSIIGFEGSRSTVKSRRAAMRSALDSAGALALGRRPGEAWLKGRFHGPYLRDELLSRRVMVDTLETATTWSRVPDLRTTVAEALSSTLGARGTAARVMCHISHLYPVGASLYFTFLARQEVGGELEQWHAAKCAASAAIIAAGATITHHHAIGRDHAPWLEAEIGEVGIELLQAAKSRLDPVGIMNPGKLIDAGALPGAPRG